jgi:thioredoxin-like negative regulator of GroEL
MESSHLEKAIIVGDGCGACKALVEGLQKKGALEKYRVVDVNSEEGRDIVSKLEIKAVPECILITKDKEGNQFARRCTDEETAEILKEASGA